MPVRLSIHPRFGIMYVAFTGHVKAEEGVAAFENYITHPDYSSGQKHLIDFSGATGFEGDFTHLMALHARLIEAVRDGQQTLFVYCAPTPLAQEMTHHGVNAWRHVKNVVVRVLKTEADAMDVIGLPNMTFAELNGTVA